MPQPYNILFVCTGNSARSIMAEVITNQLANSTLRAFSAGSQPRGEVHPMTLQLLGDLGFDTNPLRSKSWDEFAGPDAPAMDLIITVCDRAQAEPCPVWPGHPLTAAWSIPDPAVAGGSDEEVRHAFSNALRMLQQRISLLLALRPHALDRLVLSTKLQSWDAPSHTD